MERLCLQSRRTFRNHPDYPAYRPGWRTVSVWGSKALPSPTKCLASPNSQILSCTIPQKAQATSLPGRRTRKQGRPRFVAHCPLCPSTDHSEANNLCLLLLTCSRMSRSMYINVPSRIRQGDLPRSQRRACLVEEQMPVCPARIQTHDTAQKAVPYLMGRMVHPDQPAMPGRPEQRFKTSRPAGSQFDELPHKQG